MSSISAAELDARFLAEERSVDARARALALQRADRSMATPSDAERNAIACTSAAAWIPQRAARGGPALTASGSNSAAQNRQTATVAQARSWPTEGHLPLRWVQVDPT